ncbi:MAG: glycosyltransferase [Sphingobacteriales bacterium]|nr:glycosyltransferase [Sphingobacteriales bacterium]
MSYSSVTLPILKNAAFVIAPLSRWDGFYSSSIFSIAKVLAQQHKVFYIDNPFTFKDVIRHFGSPAIQQRRQALLFRRPLYRQVPQCPPNFVAVTPPSVVPLNFLPEGVLYDKLSQINEQLVFSALQRLLSDFGIQHYIFINSFNPFYYRRFPASLVPAPLLRIYHCSDDISQEAYIARHGVRLEREALRQYPLVLATSRQLCRLLEEKGARRAHYLPSGVNTELFAPHRTPTAAPPELQHEQRRVIIYTGNLSTLRLDYDLLIFLIQQLPDCLFVLIGEEKKADDSLRQYKNVKLLDAKPQAALPAYLQAAHCAIIPFLKNRLTESIYPLKINEYLAAGLPVVSSNFSEEILDFREVATLADTREQFLEAVRHALTHNSEKQQQLRRNIAALHSWQQRVQRLWDIIELHIKNTAQLSET